MSQREPSMTVIIAGDTDDPSDDEDHKSNNIPSSSSMKRQRTSPISFKKHASRREHRATRDVTDHDDDVEIIDVESTAYITEKGHKIYQVERKLSYDAAITNTSSSRQSEGRKEKQKQKIMILEKHRLQGQNVIQDAHLSLCATQESTIARHKDRRALSSAAKATRNSPMSHISMLADMPNPIKSPDTALEPDSGVIELPSSDESEGEGDLAKWKTRQSVSETTLQSFEIYFEYLEASLNDPKLEETMQRHPYRFDRVRSVIEDLEFEMEWHRKSLQPYDRNAFMEWSEELMSCIRSASVIEQKPLRRRLHAIHCAVCQDTDRFATRLLIFTGMAFDASQLYAPNWMQKLRDAFPSTNFVHEQFPVDEACFERIVLYWSLLHIKRLWCNLIKAKQKELQVEVFSISDRKLYSKQEYLRYKRLIKSVKSISKGNSMRDNMDLTKFWEDFMQPNASNSICLSDRNAHLHQDIGALKAARNSLTPSKHEDRESNKVQTPCSERRGSLPIQLNEDVLIEVDAPSQPHSSISSSEKAAVVGEKQTQSVSCLLCDNSECNGGMIHGGYMHNYCCYRCGLRQLAEKGACAVCGRPIDHVVCILPLTQASQEFIISNENVQ